MYYNMTDNDIKLILSKDLFKLLLVIYRFRGYEKYDVQYLR